MHSLKMKDMGAAELPHMYTCISLDWTSLTLAFMLQELPEMGHESIGALDETFGGPGFAETSGLRNGLPPVNDQG